MRPRTLATFGAVLMMAVVALLSAAGQDRTTAVTNLTAATNTWTPHRTSDGQPDLQGVWLKTRATPLERPKALQGKLGILAAARAADTAR